MQAVYEPRIHLMHLTDHDGGVLPHGTIGVILHVAQANGSLHNYFQGTQSPNRKSSTWWVSKSGRIEEYVSPHRKAWAQGAGNAQYNSVETEGYYTEEFTLLQLAGLAFVYRRGRDYFNWPFHVAYRPGVAGLGIHSMGGAPWGGHDCPNLLRSHERDTILTVAEGVNCEPHGKVLRAEVEHFKIAHGLPHNSVIGPRVRELLSL